MSALEPSQTPLDGIDDESLALILELQRQDAEHLGSMAKGKERQGSAPSDSETALNLYLEEVGQATISASDRRVARSMQTAVQEDANTLQQLAAQQDIATQGESSATSTASTDTNNLTGDQDMELIEKLSNLYVNGEHHGTDYNYHASGDEMLLDSEEGESSASAASRSHQTRECASCGDRRHSMDVSRAPCQHEYCRDCLQQLFENSMRDESLFPPRCCRETIPLDENLSFLPQTLAEAFRKKAVELSTPNRTYCHRNECSAFILPENCVNDVARCGNCAAETCTVCKAASHDGDCPHDEELQQVISLARTEGWQRCQKCRAVVELNIGCNHMT